MVWGYTLGFNYPRQPQLPLLLTALGAALIALPFANSKGLFGRSIWTTAFIVATTLVAWVYSIERAHRPDPEWSLLPPREAILDIEVRKTFASSDRYGRLSGIAKIRRSPNHLHDLIDKSVHFSLMPSRDEESLTPSQLVRAKGILTYIDEISTDDPFNEYLIQSGIYFELRRGKILEEIRPAHLLTRLSSRQNARLESTLRHGTAEVAAQKNVYVAMLLGKKAALSKEQKHAYLRSGTMHFFAISGLHVGVIAYTLYYLIVVILRCPPKTGAVLGLLILLVYVVVTGASPSAIRAFLMATFVWGAKVVQRQAAPFAALLASAFTVLLFDPNHLRNAGFQLSYAVVGSIVLYGVPIIDFLDSKITPFRGIPTADRQWYHKTLLFIIQQAVRLFGVSLAATVISSPLIIHYFRIFTPGAVILNMIVVPIAGLLIISGCISLICGIFHLFWFSAFLNHGAWLMICVIEGIIDIALSIPGFFWLTEFRWNGAGPASVILMLLAMLAQQSKELKNHRVRYFIPPVILLFAITLFST